MTRTLTHPAPPRPKPTAQVVTRQLEADAKYDREDAAKFRAVAQKVGTYEEFEAIVQGSHLKPMTEDVADIKLKKSLWDSSGRSKVRARRRANETHKVQCYSTTLVLPTVLHRPSTASSTGLP